ncbi:MAG: lysophospholipid acyltransferase family protein [Actinomycetes bacterium]
MRPADLKVAPPSGNPLGTNLTFKLFAGILIPILRALTKREWRGLENLPKSGPVIVCCNHISYIDVLVFAHCLYSNGRAPRFLGKESIFKVPVVGKVLAASGQVPVARETSGASHAIDSALALIEAGHCLGVYPEGTLTRDENLWPMVAKTGIARLAIMSRVPVVPFAQWGDNDLMPRYSTKLVFWRRTKIKIQAGKPLNFAKWYGKEDDQAALVEATAYVMAEITKMLEELRGELAPAEIFDPHKSDLPRTGNFMKNKKRKSS